MGSHLLGLHSDGVRQVTSQQTPPTLTRIKAEIYLDNVE